MRSTRSSELHDPIGLILTAIKMDVDWAANRVSQNQSVSEHSYTNAA